MLGRSRLAFRLGRAVAVHFGHLRHPAALHRAARQRHGPVGEPEGGDEQKREAAD
jgi:hypothetical protein